MPPPSAKNVVAIAITILAAACTDGSEGQTLGPGEAGNNDASSSPETSMAGNGGGSSAGEEASSGSAAAVRDAAMDAPTLPDTYRPPWDGRYPDVPDGYPPSHCIPPCLWELLVQCKVPGAGGPSPGGGTCIEQPAPTSECPDCRFVCDPQTGFLAEKRSTYVGSFYLSGEPCFTQTGVIVGTMPRPTQYYFRFTDGAGRVVADWNRVSATGEQNTLYCGEYDDPSAIVYRDVLVSAECTDISQQILILSLDSGCDLGTCPIELFPP